MALVLTTDSVAPRQRAVFWQEMVCQSFVKAFCRSNVDDAFRGRISTEDFGQMQISRIDARRNRVDRRRADIARCDRPRYYLCYQAAGRARYVQRQSESIVESGEIIMLNNCEPYSVDYDDNVASIILQIPQDTLKERFRSPDRCAGRKLDRHRGILRITGDFLVSCAARADDLTHDQRALTSQMALGLLADILINETCRDSPLGSQKAILMARIKQFALSRIGDPRLDLRCVSRAVGLSPRYITKLFTLEGEPFGRFLLRQRIDQCKRELSNPLLLNMHIGEIGLRSGFDNPSHFSRVFRECVGRSPTEYRAEVRERAVSPVREDGCGRS